MIFLYSALADFGAILRCILVINQMPTPLPLWHITNTVQVAPQYKFTFNTTESIHVSNRSRLSSRNNTMSYKTLLFTQNEWMDSTTITSGKCGEGSRGGICGTNIE